MRMRMFIILIALAVVVNLAYADHRNFVWTYQARTMPKDGTEMEFYQTTKLSDIDSWEYRLEIEHGLTERWDFSIYQIFAQEQGGPFQWDAFQLRTRYRLGEPGQWFVDPVLYLEYNRRIDLDLPHKLEAKLILGKTVDKFNLALNPVYEISFSPGTVHEIGLDAGACWEFSPRYSLGLESTSRFEFEDGETIRESYLGPTVSFGAGRIWYTVGPAWGLTSHSDNARVRFLMGVTF